MAQEANGIIACLYEYYAAYQPEYADKLAYIPIPIDLSINPFHPIKSTPEVVKFFIGIQQHRTAIKGTDILLDVPPRKPYTKSRFRTVRRIQQTTGRLSYPSGPTLFLYTRHQCAGCYGTRHYSRKRSRTRIL